MGKWWQRQFFDLIHGQRLIYNTCWEDPRIDRQLLQLDEQSQVVVITSAGCNALDYLLDSPAAIHAVDMNYRQNALLSLKMALIEHADYEELFNLFGNGCCPKYRQIYAGVRHHLPGWAQAFWDAKIGYFKAKGMRTSFYWRGAAGDFAWMFHTLLLGLKKEVRLASLAMLEAQTLEEQRILYDSIEPLLWSRGVTWLLRQPGIMALVGVPTPQIRLLEEGYPGGVVGSLKDNLKTVFTAVPFQDNYFWRVYLTGSYTQDCCPGYLQENNFTQLRRHIDRVGVHTATVTDFLHNNPGEYSHFVLLDHQDWLAWHDNDALLEEWDQIFLNSRAGTKILLRSAGPNLGFLPDEVTARLRFFPELTHPLHETDRVGTYGSLHLAEVL